MTFTEISLSKKYLVYKLLTNLWFVGAIWLYFYRIFITDAEVGLLDGTAFAIGLIAEVPSGVLADKFGRDKMTKLGQILAGSGLLIQAFGSNLLPFVAGQAIMMIGVSFVSGADEALFFDKLQFKETSTQWRKLVTRGSQIALLGSTAAIIVGGWLYVINPRIPWIITGLAFIISAILIWSVKETRVIKVGSKQNLFTALKEHLNDIKSGFMQFNKTKLFHYLPIIITVQGLFYTFGWGLLKLILLDRFHFNPFAGSLVIASCSLITVGLLGFMHKHAERMSEQSVITIISVLAGVSLMLSIADIGIFGYFVILTLHASEYVLHPIMSEIINYRTTENQRATVLSVSSFLRTIPYVALAPIIGYLNTENKLPYFLITWTILIGIAILLYRLFKKKNSELVVSI